MLQNFRNHSEPEWDTVSCKRSIFHVVCINWYSAVSCAIFVCFLHTVLFHNCYIDMTALYSFLYTIGAAVTT